MSLPLSSVCVADAGPLFELARLGYLSVLPKLFAGVKTAPAVLAELKTIEAPDWLIEVEPSPETLRKVETETRLGRGETEALALALDLNAWVILDDLKARNYAKQNGLTIIGTLGLLVALHQNQLAHRSPEEDLALLAQGLWIRPELLEAALKVIRKS